ncbi:MFS general substrate transporter [Schizopora paradoxa]|uniref:MFS general substrate transporter n=1 Tax=Schizopora paradoxa TaxID=27342 RepID=A0A0H2RPR0_9AGAM|nr:MFS general substrate transporter [Schizopora paradoxa]
MESKSSDSDSQVSSTIDERALLRKIDFRVIPWLALLYLLNSLDRSNIGNARLYNMETDLHMNDNQYLVALTTFFFPYAAFEMPSNVALRKLRPSRWLSFLILGWGVIMTLHGIVTNYGGLIALRVLLGLFESGLYPGIAFYLSSWYRKSELGTRIALFFTSATIAGAFGGLLAAAISNMNGIAGKPGWSWIFILEGIFTVLVGVASFWIVQDFPETAKFLTEDERLFVIQRLQQDQQLSAGGEAFKLKFVWQALSDKKTWIAMGIYMGFDGPLFAFSLFLPTIINEVSFQATAANLLSVPVYAWACLVTLGVGLLGDKIGQRAYINILLFSGGLIGYIILVASRNAALSYFACFLAASGIYPLIRAAWVSANTEGSYKRSAVLGLAIGWGNLNGAVTSNVYRAKDKPWYSLGHGIVLAYIGIGIVSSIIMRIVLKAENDRRARGERNEHIASVGENLDEKDANVYESIEDARRERGDMYSGFKYTL